MEQIIRIFCLVIFIFFSCSFVTNAQIVEYETSWKKAKIKSKRSGKPILAIFSDLKYTEMLDRYFDVDSITISLQKDFVLYFHIRGKKTPWPNPRFSSVVISDHEGNRYKEIYYYYFKEKLLEEIRSYNTRRPLYYYEQKYEPHKNDIAFLEEYILYALEYKLHPLQVMYDYYHRIDGFNCIKLNCVTEVLWLIIDTDEFRENYKEMDSLDCDNSDIENRLFSTFHRDFLFRYGREPEDSRYSDYHEAAIKTTEFLNESDRYRDSLIDYNTWKYHCKHINQENSKTQIKKANSLLLKAFDYKLENIYSQDSLQSLVFDLSTSIDNKKELIQLSEIIINRPNFINDAAMVEILAIVFYRLDETEKSSKMIVRANDIAIKNGIRYQSILPEMKEKGLLKRVKR